MNEALGGWLDDRKKELGFYDLPELTDDEKDNIKYTKQGTVSVTKQVSRNAIDRIKKHTEFWLNYRDAARNVKVLDPACGSGAFLVKVFDFLKREFESINKTLVELRPGALPELFDLDKHILTNNIFGVDLNPASVEITQLSLWLKTADRSKELTTLEKNIQCGNSLIDDAGIAGDSAFNWEKRFPQVFASAIKKDKVKAEKSMVKSNPELEEKIRIENEKSPDSRDIHDEFHEPFVEYGNAKKGFDVVVGNPPWGAELNAKEKTFLKNKYSEIDSSTPNSYAYFIGLSLNLSKSRVSLIVPDSLLLKDYEKCRNLLKENIYELHWYQNSSMPDESRPFPSVDHDVVVFHFAISKSSEITYSLSEYDLKSKADRKSVV